ncbi:MAG: cell wall hydrolase [Candidatus Eremiobacteraeota bacterium]|nr:cell wall hydrolase [Candidatus Eremiobacteraeota bacterium]
MIVNNLKMATPPGRLHPPGWVVEETDVEPTDRFHITDSTAPTPPQGLKLAAGALMFVACAVGAAHTRNFNTPRQPAPVKPTEPSQPPAPDFKLDSEEGFLMVGVQPEPAVEVPASPLVLPSEPPVVLTEAPAPPAAPAAEAAPKVATESAPVVLMEEPASLATPVADSAPQVALPETVPVPRPRPAHEVTSVHYSRYAKHQELLARAIAAESRGESYDAQVAVAQTILNHAAKYKRGLPGLIRSSFLSSNYDGNRKFYTLRTSRIPNWQQYYRAAGDALAGRSQVGFNRVYFHDDSIGAPRYVNKGTALKLDNMIFYAAR